VNTSQGLGVVCDSHVSGAAAFADAATDLDPVVPSGRRARTVPVT
jgi:hypothetical protein